MNDIILDGHESASKRREIMLRTEVARFKALADHLRAALAVLIERNGASTFTVQEINDHLGVELDSAFSDDKASITLSLKVPLDVPPPEEEKPT